MLSFEQVLSTEMKPLYAQPFKKSAVNKLGKLYKEASMKVDLYRRPEVGGQYSYLAVPQGKPIPEEATNTDWEATQRDLDLERNDEQKTGLSVDNALQQIGDKGYAISSVKKLEGIGHPN
jgi:hypothetical protein